MTGHGASGEGVSIGLAPTHRRMRLVTMSYRSQHHRRKGGFPPLIGCAFDPDQRNDVENVAAYIQELQYYRPRGFSKLVREGCRTSIQEHAYEWMQECDELLTEYARRIERHDYISFGPFEHGGAVGFYIYVEGALEDADLKVSDLGEVPKGFTGLVCQVSDHGNVTAYRYSRGKARELFAAV